MGRDLPTDETVFVWLLRIALLAFGALAFIAVRNEDYWGLAVSLATIAVLLVLYRGAKRRAKGWIVDERGERQKVERFNRGVAIYNPTTRETRIIEEAVARDERRSYILWGGLWGWAAAILTVVIYTKEPSNSPAMLGGLFPGAIAVIFLTAWFWMLGTELLYQTGYQDMKGAKVLDEAPLHPGLKQVVQQKTHGDARVASRAEALDLLDPDR